MHKFNNSLIFIVICKIGFGAPLHFLKNRCAVFWTMFMNMTTATTDYATDQITNKNLSLFILFAGSVGAAIMTRSGWLEPEEWSANNDDRLRQEEANRGFHFLIGALFLFLAVMLLTTAKQRDLTTIKAAFENQTYENASNNKDSTATPLLSKSPSNDSLSSISTSIAEQ